jgi:hypothetical protein
LSPSFRYSTSTASTSWNNTRSRSRTPTLIAAFREAWPKLEGKAGRQQARRKASESEAPEAARAPSEPPQSPVEPTAALEIDNQRRLAGDQAVHQLSGAHA